jgi:hypothetical protein
MSKTLLNGVNDVLKRLNHIKGNSGELTSLTDSQRQVVIDLTIQAWNECIIDLYDSINEPLPNELSTTNITLATGTRDYSLPTDLVQIRWPLHDKTNGRYIDEYPGGYEMLSIDQAIPTNYTGPPSYGTIRPTDGHLYIDTVPTSAENGLVYELLYDKSLIMSSAASTFPFSDTAYQMLITPVTELVKRDLTKTFDDKFYKKRMAQAVKLIAKRQSRTQWSPDRSGNVSTDPMEA